MITGGCHAVDIVRYSSGKEVEEVFSYCYKSRPDFDYDTTLVASIKFRERALENSLPHWMACAFLINLTSTY